MSLSDALPLAGVAFAWGLGKGLIYGKRHTHVAECPMCAESVVKTLTKPKRFLTHNLLGPLVEEASCRRQLQPKIGLRNASLVFGALHFSPRNGMAANAWRVADATLGGLLYGVAFNRSGLVASTICHGLHNFGADLGLLITADQGLT